MRKGRLREFKWLARRHAAGNGHKSLPLWTIKAGTCEWVSLMLVRGPCENHGDCITGLLPGLPQPSSVTADNSSWNSRKDEDGQATVSGPKRLCLGSVTYPKHAGQGPPMTQALQLEASRATRTAPHGALSTFSGLPNPHLVISTRPWPAAIPVPVKGWPQRRRIRTQKPFPLLAPSSS